MQTSQNVFSSQTPQMPQTRQVALRYLQADQTSQSCIHGRVSRLIAHDIVQRPLPVSADTILAIPSGRGAASEVRLPPHRVAELGQTGIHDATAVELVRLRCRTRGGSVAVAARKAGDLVPVLGSIWAVAPAPVPMRVDTAIAAAKDRSGRRADVAKGEAPVAVQTDGVAGRKDDEGGQLAALLLRQIARNARGLGEEAVDIVGLFNVVLLDLACLEELLASGLGDCGLRSLARQRHAGPMQLVVDHDPVPLCCHRVLCYYVSG